MSFDNVRILFGFYGVFCARDFYEREKKAASLPPSFIGVPDVTRRVAVGEA